MMFADFRCGRRGHRKAHDLCSGTNCFFLSQALCRLAQAQEMTILVRNLLELDHEAKD